MRTIISTLLAASTLWVLADDHEAHESSTVLDGPRVIKLDWSSHSPRFADLNGDGKTDIALINNAQAKIEFLIQKTVEAEHRQVGDSKRRTKWEPELEDAWFDKRYKVIDQTAFDLELADFNQDGNIDIVVTGNRDALAIHLQDEDGEFEEAWTFDDFTPKQRGRTLHITDINKDGQPDIIALGTDKIIILEKRKGELDFIITEFYVEENAAWNLLAPDLNGDDWPDLLYYHSNQNAQYLALRLQTEPGKFGAEIPIEFPSAVYAKLPGNFKGQQPTFIYSEARTGQVKGFSLKKEAFEAGQTFSDIQPYNFPLNSTIRKSSLYTWGDLNGDKRTDLIIGDSEGAQIQVFLQDQDGLFSSQKNFPAFAFLDGVSILKHPATKKTVTLQISKKERMAGVTAMTRGEELPFPTLLPLEGEPVVLLSNHESSGDFHGLLLIEKIQRNYHLTEYTFDKEEQWQARRTELKNLNNEPRGLMLANFEKNTPYLVVLGQREPAIFLKRGEDGWEERASEAPLRKTLLYDLVSDRINISDMNEDGVDELFIADTGFLRKLSYDPDKDDFKIDEQFNAPKRKQNVHLPVPYPRMGSDGMVYFDPKDNHLYHVLREGNSLLQGNNQKELPPLTPVLGRHIDLGKGKSALFLGGERRFYLLPDSGDRWNIEYKKTFFEPQTEKVRYAFLFPIHRIKDDRIEVVGIDPLEHVFEMSALSPDHEWSPILEFKLFDQIGQRGNQQANYQPRDAAIADLNNDGQEDIVLLVHDGMLIYY